MAVCRLCLNKISGKEVSNPDILNALLETFIPEMTCSLVDRPVICENCLDSVNTAYTLLQYKVESDIKIQELLDEFRVPTIDLRQLQENGNELEGSDVCRICLKMIQNDPSIRLYKIDDDIKCDLVANMFEVCNISLDLEISCSPVMCSGCWKLLQKVFTFKNHFIEVETRIKRYCHLADINTSLTPKDLEKLVSFYRGHHHHPVDTAKTRDKALNTDITERLSDPDDIFHDEFEHDPRPNETYSSLNVAESSTELVYVDVETYNIAQNSKSEQVQKDLEVIKDEADFKVISLEEMEHKDVITCHKKKLPSCMGILKPKGPQSLINNHHRNKFYNFSTLLDHRYFLFPNTETNNYIKCPKNQDLIQIYLEVSKNGTEFEDGYLSKIQEMWLKLYPLHCIPGENLSNYAYHLISNDLVPKEIMAKIRRKVADKLGLKVPSRATCPSPSRKPTPPRMNRRNRKK